MSSLIFRPAAAADVEEAYQWYELQRSGLGEEFLLAVGAIAEAILARPEQYPVIHRETRRALLRRFPYSVFYRTAQDRIVVIACFHASRDPRRWQSHR